MKIAIATFVKTPGMSPIKTRLARDIGEHEALSFYVESLGRVFNTIENLKQKNSGITPYWSLAEKQAMGGIFWKSWPQIWQGEGSLGERISKVYTELKKKYDIVVLFGADTPHVTVDRLWQGLMPIISGQEKSTVGPTEDGGFYFLASSLEVPSDVWTQVTYSSHNTLRELKSVWPGNMLEIATEFDVDTGKEYQRLLDSGFITLAD